MRAVRKCAGGSMDRASDSGSEGWGFESLPAYQQLLSHPGSFGSLWQDSFPPGFSGRDIFIQKMPPPRGIREGDMYQTVSESVPSGGRSLCSVSSILYFTKNKSGTLGSALPGSLPVELSAGAPFFCFRVLKKPTIFRERLHLLGFCHCGGSRGFGGSGRAAVMIRGSKYPTTQQPGYRFIAAPRFSSLFPFSRRWWRCRW